MGNHAVVDDDGHDDNDGHADDSDYDLEIMMMRMITEYTRADLHPWSMGNHAGAQLTVSHPPPSLH